MIGTQNHGGAPPAGRREAAHLIALAFTLLALLTGCATTGGRGDADELHMFGLPITLNFDNKPGADGFAVRVFATKGGGAKGTVIKSGAVEILMFDGIASLQELAAKSPQQVWKFTPAELTPLREQTSLGFSYRFVLRWTKPPTRSHITVAARYLPPKGDPIYSAPSAITTSVR